MSFISTDSANLLFILIGFGVTFIVARALGSRWREGRRKRSEHAAHAGETRQVRRARERKQH